MTGDTKKDFRPCGPGRLLRRLSTWSQDKRLLLSLTGERSLLLIINRFIAQAKFLINMGKFYPKMDRQLKSMMAGCDSIKVRVID